MCGIWGISDTGSGISRGTLVSIIKRLMILSEVRGKDASGIAVMHEDSLCVLRKAMASHRLLKDEDFLRFIGDNITGNSRGNIWVMGHSRLVTNGTEYNPNNNQPIANENMALVHNGIIVNEDEIWNDMPEAVRNSEVDSEVILEAFRHRYGIMGDARKALIDTYRSLKGTASTIMLVQKGHHMIAASNNGSLYEVHSRDRKLRIFASESLMLERLIQLIPELKNIIDASKITQLSKGRYVDISDDYSGETKEIEIVQDLPRKYGTYRQEIDYSKYQIDFDRIKNIKRCAKCVLPETMPFIEFDKNGVCNYCRSYRKMTYKGKGELQKWTDDFHRLNKTAMISFSGGRDSSYGLHYFVREMGIKPVAYCYDWGMVTDLARRNQSRMCEKLGIEFILVSADLKKKRNNIKKNVEAWLKNPSLGMVPIFMAGDKQYYYYANKVRRDYKLNTTLMATNPLEKTYFKFGFCGVKPDILKDKFKKLDFERLPALDVMKMSGYYIDQFAHNSSYINSSILDTATATMSYYVIPHNYFRLYEYIEWNEDIVDNTLREYDWELAEDTKTTWRIGDGTAPFYNYIYCMVAGFTENDTLRSNQIREGMIDRETALKLVYRDNIERFDSMRWYFDVINVDMEDALRIVSNISKRYE